ncbi:MAG: efflux RND transporter permease subunit [Gammaproteobacteria bacterium]|nr:MAG: efflux RND transporter permease subunit [Gammaproteobacteria bacterium]
MNPLSGGLIGIFARHATAANLVMALMMVTGLFALSQLNRQFFPDFAVDFITVSVEWPGASASDVDSNIVQAIEPEVRFLDGVKKVTSTSFEGMGSVAIEFHPGTDMQQALSDVESAVSQITTLPEDAEDPRIRRIQHYDTIGRVVVSGPYPESALKAIAKDMRDELLARGIAKVDLFGARDDELWVEVDPAMLRRLDLKLADIAARIREDSQDLPAGELEGGVRQVRSLGLKKWAAEMGSVEVKSLPDGGKVYLHDIARISDTFEDSARVARRHGNPAIELRVLRASSADALEQADIMDRYLQEARALYPADLSIELYGKEARLIRERIEVLLENGASGLVLVLVVLFLFLSGRVAFWVAVGIPASLLATMGFMYLSGQSINMVSLFGLIMAIGIVVDDAIVVGEHAQARAATGIGPVEAAVTGATRMAAPVVSSTLTTIAAFIPLLVISGIIGEIISAIPLVVITVLMASLIECFLVLPGHLREALSPHDDAAGNPFLRFRRSFDAAFARLRSGPFRRLVARAVAWRYTTVALALAAVILALGAIAGGRVGFQFFPTPESDVAFANVEMVPGTTREQTAAMLEEVDRALHQAAAELAGEDSGLVRMSLIKLGIHIDPEKSGGGTSTDNIGGLIAEFTPADQREVRMQALLDRWRALVRPRPGLENFTLRAMAGGPPGRDIDVRLAGGDPATLKQAALELRALLERIPGVSDVNDNLPWGKPETVLELTPQGQAMGFTTAEVGRQVRNALEGAIARRFARGEEEVTVRVLYPREVTDGGVLERLYLRSPAGHEVPLTEVVRFRDELGFASIPREDGRRQVAVFGEIAKGVNNTSGVIQALLDAGLPELAARHGLQYSFAGKAEEQSETFGDMRSGALVALAAIYIVLAWVFSSYTRPLVVMAIIPVGLVGAVLGHWLLGFQLTILSMVALIGLSGIVVNDSIVLVTTIDERRRSEPLRDAIIDGACDRLRAVILTSATTIGGLTPLLFERSLQAQFLIPMALTIVFGLAVTTAVVLFLVPALIAIQDDFAHLFGRAPGRQEAAPA